MSLRPLFAAGLSAAVLVGAVVSGTSSQAAAPAGSGVVFSVFENLPPNGACPGLYAVDSRTRAVSWVGGWDSQRRDSALFPAFTANGTFSFGLIVDPSSSAGETYYSIRTVRVDGRDERLLAVTDEEDLNVRSLPVWKPATARVGQVGDLLPAGWSVEECVRLVTSLRDRTS